MGVNNGRCKMAIEEMGIPDFAITIFSNSRSNLLGKNAYGRDEGGRRSMGASGGN
ncbi:hypothetical protein CE91St54_53740 [Hungatella hathewayi]|uniref:Uncharacterized protein n=1 Tax=Hungatella hathewayi TaxID=154046 RepID=A0AA37N7I4_9FIRM|nr:hypothetical protein CE91St55_27720 [Hungatella hathewayi]GKH10266.1 hypothetical protein CE91St54_53740 [Hungatella hathewayi]